ARHFGIEPDALQCRRELRPLVRRCQHLLGIEPEGQYRRADGEGFTVAIHDVATRGHDRIGAHGAGITVALELLVVQHLQVNDLPGYEDKQRPEHHGDAGQSPGGLMLLSYLAVHSFLSLFRTTVFSSSGTTMSSCDVATSSTLPCATRLL